MWNSSWKKPSQVDYNTNFDNPIFNPIWPMIKKTWKSSGKFATMNVVLLLTGGCLQLDWLLWKETEDHKHTNTQNMKSMRKASGHCKCWMIGVLKRRNTGARLEKISGFTGESWCCRPRAQFSRIPFPLAFTARKRSKSSRNHNEIEQLPQKTDRNTKI